MHPLVYKQRIEESNKGPFFIHSNQFFPGNMRQVLLISALAVLSFAALTNKQQFSNKVLKLGVTSKITSNTTIGNVTYNCNLLKG